jgi:hypothetical protein
MSRLFKKRLLAAFVLVSLTAGCGIGTSDDKDNFNKALAYSQCMRDNGVPDYPDPEKADGGGVKMRQPKPTSSAAMTKALEACRDKAPQNDSDDNDPVDQAKLAEWTKCMRGKLPKFPDPQVDGTTITIQLNGTGIKPDSTDFKNAFKACDDKNPGGSMNVTDVTDAPK